MNKENPFHAPFPLIFFSNLLIAFEVKLLTNPVNLSPAKRIVLFVSAFFPKLPNQEPKDLPDAGNNLCSNFRLPIFSYLMSILFLSYFSLQIVICLIVYLLV